MAMYETNEKVKQLLENKICEVVAKGDISPSEMECVEKAYKTLQSISTIEAMEEYGDNEERSMRRGGRSMRGNQSYHGGYYEWEPEYSMTRGRGADGRYISRGGNYDRMSMTDSNTQRSYHSASDRMIAALETELNDNISDYERQKIMEEIRRLKEMKD